MTSNNILKNEQITLVHDDCLSYLKTLPDNHIDLIATDPPYYKIKKNAWDNQWATADDYLAWLDDIFSEFWRVLKPTGSLYCFCGAHLSSEIEILAKQRFNVLNNIVWAKTSGHWKRAHKESLRRYFSSSERIIFAEHYGAEGSAKGQIGYASKCSDTRKQVFSPLIDYFKSARELLNISATDINKATGTQMCSHWFSNSQWQLPSEIQYKALQDLFNRVALEQGLNSDLNVDHKNLSENYEVLARNYQILIREYDGLKAQYELLRRPFTVSSSVPHTDVWTYSPVNYYPGKHPCEKPAAMMEDIINASSRPGDLIADFFMGSGSTIKAAKKLGRMALGVEFEEETFIKTASALGL